MVCKKCHTRRPPRAETCPRCGTPVKPRLRTWKALAWAALYVGIPVFQAAVAVTFLTRHGDGATAGPDRSRRDGGPPETIFDQEPDEPLLEKVVLDGFKERSLLNVILYVNRSKSAEAAASAGLDKVVERIRGVGERIASDIRTGGPLSERGFRQRWDQLVHPDRDPSPPWLPDADAELEHDVVQNRPVNKARLLALADFAKALRAKVESAIGRERAVTEFIDAVPAAAVGPRLFFESDPATLAHARKQLTEKESFESAVESSSVGLYADPGMRVGTYPSRYVDSTDFLFLLFLERGVVRAAYESKSLDLNTSLARLLEAESLLRGFLSEGGFGGPETWTPAPVATPPNPSLQGLRTALTPESPSAQVTEASKVETKSQAPPNPEPDPVPKVLTPLGPYRRWTNLSRRTFYGRLMDTEPGFVVLEGPKRDRVRVSTDDLSKRDMEYLVPFFAPKPPRR